MNKYVIFEEKRYFHSLIHILNYNFVFYAKFLVLTAQAIASNELHQFQQKVFLGKSYSYIQIDKLTSFVYLFQCTYIYQCKGTKRLLEGIHAQLKILINSSFFYRYIMNIVLVKLRIFVEQHSNIHCIMRKYKQIVREHHFFPVFTFRP